MNQRPPRCAYHVVNHLRTITYSHHHTLENSVDRNMQGERIPVSDESEVGLGLPSTPWSQADETTAPISRSRQAATIFDLSSTLTSPTTVRQPRGATVSPRLVTMWSKTFSFRQFPYPNDRSGRELTFPTPPRPPVRRCGPASILSRGAVVARSRVEPSSPRPTSLK
jgi:hypothetical protein